MERKEYQPPRDEVCPKCGAEASWQPPARPGADDAWEAEFACSNGHRFQLFSKPKQRAVSGRGDR